MITEKLLDFFYAIAQWVIGVIPGLDTSSYGGFAAIVTSLYGVSNFMPVTAFGVALVLYVGIHSVKLISSIVNWIIRKIPTIS